MNTTSINPMLIYLGEVIYIAVSIYIWMIIIRVLLTWINPNPYSPVMRFLAKGSDPVLNRSRRLFPLTLGGLDFSPVLAIMVIYLVGAVLGRWLIGMGKGLPPIVLGPILLLEILRFLDSVTWLLIIIMSVRFIIALAQPSPYNALVRVIYGLTEPFLGFLRRFFPPLGKGLDMRPLVFLLILVLFQRLAIYPLASGIAAKVGSMIGGVGGG